MIDNYKKIIDMELTVHVNKRSCQIKEKLDFTIGDIVFM